MRRTRLGQHYLVDVEVIRKVVETADIKSHERVLEIGTGRGALSKELVGLGASFEGLEIDSENYELTRQAVGQVKANLRLGDAFIERPKFDVLVSSLPYSKSAEFIEWISKAVYDRAVVILQEDFVRKILATPGSRDYRGISVIAQASSEFKVISKVGRSSFSPPPKVNSVIVSVMPRRRLTGSQISKVKRLFSLRRRKVAAAFTELGMGDDRGFGERRVYSLTPEEVLRVCGWA